MEQTTDTFTFLGTEYEVESLSERGKYFVAQIKDLQNQGNRLRHNVDQVEVALQAFTKMLQEELESEEPETAEEE
jgi:uncharacterized protein YqhQ